MVFTSVSFTAFFLPLFLAVYFVIPARRLGARNFAAFLFSAAFYAFGGVRYLLLLAGSVLANYLAGLALGGLRSPGARKAVLVLAVAVNLGLLGVFKYAGFLTAELSSVFPGLKPVSFVLPVGISFYTFQGMSYVFDVFRGSARAAKNPLTVGLYISLFPQLVAGPIVRYTDIERELGERRVTADDFACGAVRFMTGFGKKLILADTMGKIADGAFSRVGGNLLTLPLAWTGAAAFALQIYLDFSSYSDMAIGLGRMIGFRFRENFDRPYTSLSVTEFWRRWHISLSTWFRDYVYIPLGGNRRGKGRQIFNLLVVWTLTGIWHGANWTFLVWGLYYGVLLIFEKFALGDRIGKIPKILRLLSTAAVVLVGWVIFRSATLGDAGRYLAAMCGVNGFGARETVYFLREYAFEIVLSLLVSLVPFGLLFGSERAKAGLARFSPVLTWLKAAGAFAVFGYAYIRLVSGSFSPFIYFQF